MWFDSLPHWDLLWLPLGLESGPRYDLTLILNTQADSGPHCVLTLFITGP